MSNISFVLAHTPDTNVMNFSRWTVWADVLNCNQSGTPQKRQHL